MGCGRVRSATVFRKSLEDTSRRRYYGCVWQIAGHTRANYAAKLVGYFYFIGSSLPVFLPLTLLLAKLVRPDNPSKTN